ncbi:hypothetical protein L1S32_10455 [Methanogenium sp. S4BF]|uniref:hypothetical protein n=1 Tax=Methanogenium sp. S4BF TaxID=1789226 RepID=UPI0024179F6F|nr:hypothetical protein [Methanogenium sp. S4BF]WFN34252.1 hypothetical protein L1S32_10455 [Methanogenium sp. S4BF]
MKLLWLSYIMQQTPGIPVSVGMQIQYSRYEVVYSRNMLFLWIKIKRVITSNLKNKPIIRAFPAGPENISHNDSFMQAGNQLLYGGPKKTRFPGNSILEEIMTFVTDLPADAPLPAQFRKINMAALSDRF